MNLKNIRLYKTSFLPARLRKQVKFSTLPPYNPDYSVSNIPAPEGYPYYFIHYIYREWPNGWPYYICMTFNKNDGWKYDGIRLIYTKGSCEGIVYTSDYGDSWNSDGSIGTFENSAVAQNYVASNMTIWTTEGGRVPIRIRKRQ